MAPRRSAIRYSRSLSSSTNPMLFKHSPAPFPVPEMKKKQHRAVNSQSTPLPVLEVEEPQHRAVISLGSNQGDRIGNIEHALKLMTDHGLKIMKTSPLYQTKPMYYLEQDYFINGVCQVATDLEPLALLDVLQEIENSLGRIRTIAKGPRTIDLDILLYGQQYIQLERLQVPHPLMLEREFVLRPLVNILSSQALPMEYTGTERQMYVAEYLKKLESKDPSMSRVTLFAKQLPLWHAADPTTQTQIMAILNLTPDSFSDGGKHVLTDVEMIKNTVRGLISAGAAIIDVGGQSTRPQADLISPKEELERVLPIISAIREMPEAANVAISIDTFYAEVARKAVEAGADIVNDISAGTYDQDMLSTVAETGATIVLMHLRGDPKTMTKMTDYPDGVLSDVSNVLRERVKAARAAGIYPWRIILDPGIGFAKNQPQNLELLRTFSQAQLNFHDLSIFKSLPWLVGASRKGFIGKITGVHEASQRIWGTAAAVTASIQQGAAIVRVHDVAEMAQVAKMADAIYRFPQKSTQPRKQGKVIATSTEPSKQQTA